MSGTNAHTRFGSPASPNRPKGARTGRDNLPHGSTRQCCKWCNHDDANRGEGGTCTFFGDIPLDNAGPERMCFGDIIKRAQENSAALEETIGDPCRHDHGGRPGATRERVSHAQEIAHHWRLLQDAREEQDPSKRKEARNDARIYRKYRTLYVVPNMAGVCKAREHAEQYTFPPAKCAGTRLVIYYRF